MIILIKKIKWIYLVVFAVLIFPVLKFGQVKADDFSKEMTQGFIYKSDDRPDPFVSLLNASGGEREMGPSLRDEMNLLLQKVEVNGVLWDNKMPLVMINNKIRKQGDVVENLTIKEIKLYSVIFSYHDLTEEVYLIKKKDYYDQGGL